MLCNTTKLREHPESSDYHCKRKLQAGPRLMAEPNGNNVRDWAIRSQAPKAAMVGYGEGSETRWLWV